MHRRLFVVAAIACAVIGLAACGDDDDTAEPAGDAGSSITISNFAFSEASVRAGATVNVENDDTTTHTVVSDTNGQFDTGNIGAGETATFTAPAEPGTYPFHCGIHQTTMKGTLTVVP